MIVQTPVKPDEKKQAPKNDKPPATPGPKANGPPSNNGLANAGGGGDGGEIGGGGGSSKFGWYAAQVQNRIVSAMLQNPKTREASFRLKIHIWADGTGRITRAEFSGTSGDAAVDTALKNEVLTNLQLQEPPPQDMPMPIIMQVAARRPL